MFLILLLEIQQQMFQLCFSARCWTSFEAKQLIFLYFFWKGYSFTVHSTLQLQSLPHSQVLQLYSASLMYVLTHPTKTNKISGMAPITNHYPLKNISIMSWDHNARPCGGLEFFTSFTSLSKISHFLLAKIYLFVLSD